MKEETMAKKSKIRSEYSRLREAGNGYCATVVILSRKYYMSEELVKTYCLGLGKKYHDHSEDLGKGEKACCICGEVRPVDGFNRHPGTRDGYFGYCKKCQSARDRDNRARKIKIKF